MDNPSQRFLVSSSYVNYDKVEIVLCKKKLLTCFYLAWLTVWLRDAFTFLIVTQQVLRAPAEKWILLLVVALLFVMGCLLLVLSRLEVITEEQQKVLKVLWHRKMSTVIVKHSRAFNFEY